MLGLVFKDMRKTRLRLKAQKCELSRGGVSFLGHVINRNSLVMDPNKINKIKDYPRPRNVAEVRTFLGMTSCYRMFTLRFAKISEKLYKLTSLKVSWRWSEQEEKVLKSSSKSYPKPQYYQDLIHAEDGSCYLYGCV